jgi:hypothetical protein
MSTSFHEWAAADTDPTTLRRVDQARTDFALIESNLEFIASQLAKQPTRGDLAKTALGIIFCSAVLTTLFVWIAWRRPATRAGAIIAVAIALACAGPLTAKEYRSREVAREFQREHPCPSTGLPSGGCPGYRRDHVVPLACAGPDSVSNMQWQTIRDARAKDRWEQTVSPPATRARAHARGHQLGEPVGRGIPSGTACVRARARASARRACGRGIQRRGTC